MAMSSIIIVKFLTGILLYANICNGHVTITAWEDDIQEVHNPPPVFEVARMARYVVHSSDWCSISSIASHGKTSGYPKARVYSMVDGSHTWSSGVPYIYATLQDPQIADLVENNRSSVSVSLAEEDYCKQKNYDPEDPRCAQVILTGQFSFINQFIDDVLVKVGRGSAFYIDHNPRKVEAGTREFLTARTALFERHPAMKSWPKNHHWKVGKLTIEEIQVVDYFGGSRFPSVADYFKATPY